MISLLLLLLLIIIIINHRAVLNICFAYTSRHELVHSISQLSQAVEEGILQWK